MPTARRMEVTEYLDGNDGFGLKVKYPPRGLRGVWVDAARMFAGNCQVPAEVAHGQIMLSLVGHAFPVGNRNVKVVYWADVPVTPDDDAPDACELCEGEGAAECPTCEGSGAGRWGQSLSLCRDCKGKRVVPCKCQEAKADARRDGE